MYGWKQLQLIPREDYATKLFFSDFPPVFQTKSSPLPGSKLAVDQEILSGAELVNAVNVKCRKPVKDQIPRVLHIPMPKVMGFIFGSCSPKSSRLRSPSAHHSELTQTIS